MKDWSCPIKAHIPCWPASTVYPMLKPNLLRATLSQAVPYLRENPDKLAIWLDKGTVVATGQMSLSFEYRYTAHVIVMDYPYSIDTVTLPAMLWIHRHQPDLIFNPDRRKTGFTFEADILNNATADIMLHIELTEAVKVSDVNNTLALTHLDEPVDPRSEMLAAWEHTAANTPWAD